MPLARRGKKAIGAAGATAAAVTVTAVAPTVAHADPVHHFTSTGAGPAKFDGVPVPRFCIRTDLACDATSLQSIPGS
ncbi:hypothetical protein ACH4SK_43060 [Streptomyces inhibens]|uniref:hypothetical protein n=1 Tax=Streptomyces inhibens TaxID=2293571 RepID=UPI0037ABDF7D